MRFRGLVIFPLLYALVFIAVALWLGDGDGLRPFVLGQKVLVRVLAIIGCYWAVSVFERGDHLRRAWHWMAVATILVLVRDLIRLVVPDDPAVFAYDDIVVRTLGVASNLGLLSGVWLLSRAWKMAALSLPGGRSRMITVAVIAAVLALAVAGHGALTNVQKVMAGDWGALIMAVSAVVDILSLCLLAPLLMTAVALRGGHFFWPWALLTASLLSWLLYDAGAALEGVARVKQALGTFPLAEVFRGLAENFLFAAGLAQSMVIRRVRQEAG
jgi:hypothetical protein